MAKRYIEQPGSWTKDETGNNIVYIENNDYKFISNMAKINDKNEKINKMLFKDHSGTLEDIFLIIDEEPAPDAKNMIWEGELWVENIKRKARTYR
jgi:hypothetical protein